MDREQIEILLKKAYEDGKADTGLYDAGIRYVVMDSVDGALTFAWYDSIQSLDGLVPDDSRSVQGSPGDQEAPELWATFFASAILTRPGANLIETVRSERTTT